MNISRTYPQPDSPMAHLGARERALGVLKYVGLQEPEKIRQEHVAGRFASLVALYADEARSCEELAIEAIQLVGPLGMTMTRPAAEHPLFACVVHSFAQARRAQRGEALSPSLVDMIRS